MSTRLYVGNLPKEPIERDKLQSIFEEDGTQVSAKVIKDRKTGKCRGFAFITVPNDDVANELIEKHNGETFMDSPLKIEIAQPRSKTKASTKEDSPSPSASSNRRSDRGKKPSSSAGSSGVQPDPRWASELAQIKERLATQASNS